MPEAEEEEEKQAPDFPWWLGLSRADVYPGPRDGSWLRRLWMRWFV